MLPKELSLQSTCKRPLCLIFLVVHGLLYLLTYELVVGYYTEALIKLTNPARSPKYQLYGCMSPAGTSSSGASLPKR